MTQIEILRTKPAKVKIIAKVMPPDVAAPTPKQIECNAYHSAGSYLHFLTFGGARSTKTFRNVRLIVARALLAPGSRHAIVRATQKSVRASIQMDTLPKVMKLCYPGLRYRLNKSEGVIFLPNGSEIWLAGMDNAQRVEKILGQEFATIFFNEASELAFTSVLLIWTRLAQSIPLANNINKKLRLLALYDCNPPKKKHWTYQLFADKIDPITQKNIPNPKDFGLFQMNPADNPHLPEQTKKIYQNLPPEQRKRFWLGEFGDAVEGALWNWASFKPFPPRNLMPDFRRIVVAVDPPGGTGVGNTAEAGIVVVGLGADGMGYVLKDCSLAGKTEDWAGAAVKAYHHFQADCIVGEVNFGGDMVRAAVHAVDDSANFKAVRASRGKAKRAEPVAALYGQNRVAHAPGLDALENQMCDFTSDFDVALMGYSPDRVDALVWGLTEIMLTKTNSMGSIGATGT